jgi:lipopolysaccharide transport system permease protein
MQASGIKNDIEWDYVICPERNLLDIRLGELWDYRDLLYMFVKKDFVTIYKQTILGPLWFILQPLLTMVIFIIVFSRIARISTDGIPASAFYLTGIIIWNYFFYCLKETSNTFISNANIYGKIYYPRLINPLAKIISGFISFIIQSILLIVVIFYLNYKNADISPVYLYFYLLPVLLSMMVCLALGCGLIISALTTKYRDLIFLVSFGLQLLMFATPVIYPVSFIPDEYKSYIFWNPLTHIFESCKFIVLGSGEVSVPGLTYTAVVAVLITITGIILFNKTEQDFMDTV